jgi:multimeric flavodoxin WrbA
MRDDADAVPRLLIVHHTPSPATHALLEAVREGAADPELAEVEVRVRPALTATAIDVLQADGYLLGTPANLGYIAGALKHFFDTIYYPCLDATVGRPFGAWIHGNADTAGAERAIATITTGLRWRPAQPPLIVTGEPRPDDLAACRELGAAVAAGLLLTAD